MSTILCILFFYLLVILAQLRDIFNFGWKMGSNYFHKISSFELVRDSLFFKFFKFFEDFSNVKAFESKIFGALKA